MKNERKYTFTPNKISSKIPVDIKNLPIHDKKQIKRESRENLHFVEYSKLTKNENFPKINIGLLKNSQKTTSLRDILIKNIEIKKTQNVSPNYSPKESNKNQIRATSTFSKNSKISIIEEPKKEIKNIVSVEKSLEKNKSVPPKHFNISLVYSKNRHNRKLSEGNTDNFENNNIINGNDCKNTKTTKDSSFTSFKINNLKSTNLEVESIEELHFVYNNLYQQNKALAFRFENLDIDEEVVFNEDGKSIYIN